MVGVGLGGCRVSGCGVGRMWSEWVWGCETYKEWWLAC